MEQLAQNVPSRLVVLWNRETRLKQTEVPGGTVGTECSLTSRVPSRFALLWNRETRLKQTEVPGGTVGTECSLTSRGALE